MKKHLLEIETAGIILVVIGIICSLVWGAAFGAWPATIGMLLWLVVFLYRAFHWQEYERENKQGIRIILLAIVILLVQMILKRWT